MGWLVAKPKVTDTKKNIKHKLMFTYRFGQELGTVEILHFGSNPQRLSRMVHRYIGIHSQLALWKERKKTAL